MMKRAVEGDHMCIGVIGGDGTGIRENRLALGSVTSLSSDKCPIPTEIN